MTNINAPRYGESTGSDSPIWFVPIVACRQGSYRDALGGALKFLEAYWHLWDPGVEVRFVSAWTGEHLRVGLQVSASTADRAREAAENIEAAVCGSQHRVTVGRTTSVSPWPDLLPLTYEFVPREVPDGIISERSLLFAPRSAGTEPFQLVLDLVAPSDPSVRVAAADGQGDPGHSSASEGRSLVAVALHGGGRSARAIAALVAADSSEDGFLVPVAATGGVMSLPRAMPTRLVGHLLALPGRVGDLLPEDSPVPAEELHAAIEQTPTPHVLVLGASGQGKSTCLTAIGRRSLQTGRSVVAIDVHDGHLARALYQEAVAAGRPALFADLTPDSNDRSPTLPLWLRPPGVAVERHIDEQFDILRNDAWAGSDGDWWGPVGTRLTRAGLALVVKDPARQLGLSQLPRLFDPDEHHFRRETLSRIGDHTLSRLVHKEVMPMVTAAHADNAMTWILAKFEPFASPQVSKILESPHGRIPIDELMGRGYSLFVHVPIGLLGAVPAKLMAGLVLHRAFSAILRGGLPNPVDFIEDEYHLYASTLTSRMMAESRKFGTRLVLANQNLAQLQRETRDTVLGNVGSVACYRLNPADALIMDGLFPTIPMRALQTLRPHTIALTTFADDGFVSGPTPSPDTGQEPSAWGSQLRDFWGGDEPTPWIADSANSAQDTPSRARVRPLDEIGELFAPDSAEGGTA